jgi:hypothetical protein
LEFRIRPFIEHKQTSTNCLIIWHEHLGRSDRKGRNLFPACNRFGLLSLSASERAPGVHRKA